jgi:hypothetical protein
VDDLINSSLSRESKENKVTFNFTWKHNEKTNDSDFSHQTSNFTDDTIKSFILTLRFFIQDNEPTSIRNMNKLYEGMTIPDEFKLKFRKFQKNLNDFLDEPALTFNQSKLTKRQIYDAIIFGDYAHKNIDKSRLLETWKKNQLDWDVVFYEFQKTLYTFIEHLQKIKSLNEIVLKELEK